MAATLGWRLAASNGGSHGNNELVKSSCYSSMMLETVIHFLV